MAHDLRDPLLKEVSMNDLPTLIESKLVVRRFKDMAYVIELIRSHHLDESFAQQLKASVRDRFIHCVEQRRLETNGRKTRTAPEKTSDFSAGRSIQSPI
jgi:hypothetical protein